MGRSFKEIANVCQLIEDVEVVSVREEKYSVTITIKHWQVEKPVTIVVTPVRNSKIQLNISAGCNPNPNPRSI